MSRNIFTNNVVGGLAAAVLGLGLAIGAGSHTPATAAPAALKLQQPVAPASVALQVHKAAAAPAPKTEAPAAQAEKAAPAAPAAPKPAAPAAPKPVAGLNQTQMNNAKKIVDTAKSMNMNEKAQTIAIATAMQESNLKNLASTKIAESYKYTDEGEGSDYDSVGLFQQRPNWGKTKDLMTPETSTKKFLQALKQVDGWEDMPVTVAAQTVQVSAYPDHYAKHETAATQIVQALR